MRNLVNVFVTDFSYWAPKWTDFLGEGCTSRTKRLLEVKSEHKQYNSLFFIGGGLSLFCSAGNLTLYLSSYQCFGILLMDKYNKS
jgi:hypothetical protein